MLRGQLSKVPQRHSPLKWQGESTLERPHGSLATLERLYVGIPAGSCRARATSKIRDEVFTETIHLLEEHGRFATIAFARRVEPLEWSNRKLTYFVHGSAEEAEANAELVLPDICADAKALAANGFQSVSPSTSQFIQQREAAIPRRPSRRAIEKASLPILKLIFGETVEVIRALGLPTEAGG